MEVKALKASILSNTIPHFLVFIQKEPKLCSMYLQSISSTVGTPIENGFSFDEFASSLSVEREERIYVIRDDTDILKSEKCVDYIRKSGKYVFLVYDDLDKTCWLYKENKDLFVLFNTLDKYTLVLYAKKILSDNKVTVDQNKLLELADRCNCNLGIFLNEIDKIVTLGDANTELLVEYMLKSGFSDYRSIDMFVFINRFLDGDRNVVSDLVKINDSPTVILYNTYNLARKRFLSNGNKRYLQIMEMTSRLFNSVVDGSMSETVALKYLMMGGIAA